MWRETQGTVCRQRGDIHFNPLPPCGGRRRNAKAEIARAAISIHSLRVEGDPDLLQVHWDADISIHSLRVEGDRSYAFHNFGGCNFNPLPPCGGRPSLKKHVYRHLRFQSTPSVWRETQLDCLSRGTRCISIHSLRVEGDQRALGSLTQHRAFQSTPSVWRETNYFYQNRSGIAISIHSLRVEGD